MANHHAMSRMGHKQISLVKERTDVSRPTFVRGWAEYYFRNKISVGSFDMNCVIDVMRGNMTAIMAVNRQILRDFLTMGLSMSQVVIPDVLIVGLLLLALQLRTYRCTALSDATC
jgi:hypothetical protein